MVNAIRLRLQRGTQASLRLGCGAVALVLVASQPFGLVLCRGTEGHVALESQVTSSCCTPQQLRVTESAVASSAGDCVGCEDTAIVVLAASPRHAAKDGGGGLGPSAAVAVPPVAPPTNSVCPLGSTIRTHAAQVPDLLRTVVLLT